MLPANGAAKRGVESLHRALDEARVVRFHWTPTSVLVIDNWIAFHGRGPCIDRDQGRMIERMTVGGSLT